MAVRMSRGRVDARLTSRRYGGIKVRSRSVRGVGEKQLGLASAAVAIIHECAPESAPGQHQSSVHKTSARTCNLPYPQSVLVTLTVPVLNNSHIPTHALDKFYNRP